MLTLLANDRGGDTVTQLDIYIPKNPRRPLTKAEIKRRKQRRRKRKMIKILIIMCMTLILMAFLTGIFALIYFSGNYLKSKQIQATISTRAINIEKEVPDLQQDFLTINTYSRPGDKLTIVKNIFVHYTANPGTDEVQNRSYFEGLAESEERSASAHFIIGFDGDIIQCIPLDEIAYAVKTRNEDSISIECCYLDEDGKFTRDTYKSLLKLLNWLLDTYQLEPEDVLRHYDEGGKECPKYYVQYQEEWDKLLVDLKEKSF